MINCNDWLQQTSLQLTIVRFPDFIYTVLLRDESHLKKKYHTIRKQVKNEFTHLRHTLDKQ